MQKTTKILLAIFLLLVILKLIIGIFVTFPLGFADNYIYLKMANSFIHEGSFFFDGIKYTLYPPAYSVLISPAYLFNDFNTTFLVIKIINAIISSTILFLSYLLARILFNKKRSLQLSLLISLFPPIFAIAFYPLSENLFYPLTLLGFYFLYKSIVDKRILWDILTGITLGILYLTRMSSVFMIVLVIIVTLYFLFKRNYKQFFRKTLALFASFIVVLPWLIRNVINLGFSMYGILGRYGKTISTVSNNSTIFLFLKWFVYNITYISISVGIILVIAIIIYWFVKGRKENNTFFNLSLLFLIIYFVFYTIYTCSVYKPMGRYFVPIIPLLILIGFYSIKGIKEIDKKYLWIFSSLFAVIFASSYLLSQYTLFPTNNMELSLIGALKVALIHFGISNPIVFLPLFFIIPFIFLFVNKLKISPIINLFLIFFVITNILNCGIIIYDINTRWNDLENAHLGKWIDENLSSDEIIYIDMRDHMFDAKNFIRTSTNEMYNETLMITTMLTNNKISSVDVNELESGYLLSSYDLDYDCIYELKSSGSCLYLVS